MNLPLATAFISFYKVFYFTMLIEPGFLPPPSASPSIFLCICFPLRPLMILLESRSVTMFVYFLTFVLCASSSAFTNYFAIYSALSPTFIRFSWVSNGWRVCVWNWPCICSESEGFYLSGCYINHQIFSARRDPWPLTRWKEFAHVYHVRNGCQIKYTNTTFPLWSIPHYHLKVWGW